MAFSKDNSNRTTLGRVRSRVRVCGLVTLLAGAMAACSDGTTSPVADADAGDLADGDLGGDLLDGDLADSDVAEGDLVDGDGSDDVDGDGGEPGAASIRDVLTCGSPGNAGGLNRGDELQRVDLDLSVFPDAVCNDGTGALFYFRPHEGDANANRWVFQLQGGGGCRSPDDCANRWCSVGTNFGMTQMTASLAPSDGINGAGILSRRAANPIGDFNQVFVRYCSSDSWAGTARNVVVTAEDPAGGGSLEMRLDFAGLRILDAVLDTLRADGVDPLEYALGGGSVAMPDLDDAEVVFLAGASAGGAGVVNNADRVRERLEATNTNCAGATCNLAYRVLVDSHYGANRDQLDYENTPFCLEEGVCSYEDLMLGTSLSTDVMTQRIGDASCLAFHEDTDDEWRCTDDNHVLENHITAPMFVRMGQTDSLVAGNAIESNFGYEGEPLDLPTFARLVREQLEALGTLPDTAEEGDELEVAPGYFGPTCSKHETLRSNPDIFDLTIQVDAAEYSMFDVFTNWIAGNDPSGVVAQTPADNVCP